MRIAESRTNAPTDTDLRSTEFLDHESAEVRALVENTITDRDDTDVRRAVALYYAVRDGMRYDVYGADLSRDGVSASGALRSGGGMCLHKSVVYAAALRAVGIPSRLVFYDVRNHLTSEQLRKFVGGDVFYYHCLANVYLDGRWLRATPVFNRRLCLLYGTAPLEFDGVTDSLHHPYDLKGQRYMEFLRCHGDYDDLPYGEVLDGLRRHHPRLFQTEDRFVAGSLTEDAARTPSTEDASQAE